MNRAKGAAGSKPPEKQQPTKRARDREQPVKRSRDRELESATAAHYEDPAYYAKTYQGRVDDVRYYVELAREIGEVIELGCGNGRILLPSARAGAKAFGVDLSREMLDDLAARVSREPEEIRARLEWKRGDMREVRLGEKAALVTCPFNAFLHLYEREDVERFLATVRAHLAPRGTLVFDVSIPVADELARDPRRAYHAPRFRYPGLGSEQGEIVKYTERFDYDALRQILFVTMEFTPVGGESSWVTPLAHRQFYPQELEALLHYNGFEIVERYGDFDRSELTRESPSMIVHARAKRV